MLCTFCIIMAPPFDLYVMKVADTLEIGENCFHPLGRVSFVIKILFLY